MHKTLTTFLICCISILFSCGCCRKQYREDNSKMLSELFFKAEGQMIRQQEDSALMTIATIEKILSDRLTRKEAEVGVIIYNNLGYLAQFRLNNYPLAFIYYNKGLMLGDRHDEHSMHPSLYHNIGNVYQCFGDNETALNYFRLALETAKKTGKHKSYLLILCTIAINNINAGDYNGIDYDLLPLQTEDSEVDASLREYSRMFLRGYEDMCAGRNDIAVQMFDSALSLTYTRPEREEMLANAYHAKGVALIRTGNAEQAAKVFRNAICTLDSIQIQGELPALYRSLAQAYAGLGKKAEADSIWLKFYKLNYDNFGSRGANALSSIIFRQEKELHQLQLQRITTRNRNITVLSVLAGCSLVIVISLLIWLYRKEKRKSHLINDLYRRTLAAMPGDGEANAIIEDSPKASESENIGGSHDRDNDDIESQAVLEEIYHAVNKTMATSPQIYESGFSINALADLLGHQTYIVSQAINIIGNRNFSTLLAEYRIAEACKRITDEDKYNRHTIAALGESVGFQSRTNFSSVFKKITGLSPSEFKKEHARSK